MASPAAGSRNRWWRIEIVLSSIRRGPRLSQRSLLQRARAGSSHVPLPDQRSARVARRLLFEPPEVCDAEQCDALQQHPVPGDPEPEPEPVDGRAGKAAAERPSQPDGQGERYEAGLLE